MYEGRNHSLVADAEPDDWLMREMQEKNGAALREWTKAQAVPVFAVRGNHDCKDYWNVLGSWEEIGGRVVRVADRLFVAGIGWSGSRYFETPMESDLEPECEMIRRQARRCIMPSDSLVLVTHYPALLPDLFPWPHKTEGLMFACIRRLIEQLGPLAVVQGHVHELFGLSGVFQHMSGKTLVLNPGPHGILLSVDTAARSAICT